MSFDWKFFDGLEENVAYETGATLEEVRLTRQGRQWRLIIKVTTEKGTKKISFTTAPSLSDVLYLFERALNSTSVTLKWREDKY